MRKYYFMENVKAMRRMREVRVRVIPVCTCTWTHDNEDDDDEKEKALDRTKYKYFSSKKKILLLSAVFMYFIFIFVYWIFIMQFDDMKQNTMVAVGLLYRGRLQFIHQFADLCIIHSHNQRITIFVFFALFCLLVLFGLFRLFCLLSLFGWTTFRKDEIK